MVICKTCRQPSWKQEVQHRNQQLRSRVLWKSGKSLLNRRERQCLCHSRKRSLMFLKQAAVFDWSSKFLVSNSPGTLDIKRSVANLPPYLQKKGDWKLIQWDLIGNCMRPHFNCIIISVYNSPPRKIIWILCIEFHLILCRKQNFCHITFDIFWFADISFARFRTAHSDCFDVPSCST